ncbi:MAG: hypothetical protein Fues2KO_26180 [Fuerstiella sp.]
MNSTDSIKRNADLLPSVSVVMGVYNAGDALDRTIDSILGQSMTDFELIVVDDGSTDETPEKLATYAAGDSRIRIVQQKNGGLTSALSRGCEAARAAIIARQDAGDISLPTRLQTQFKYLSTLPDVVAVGCGVRRVSEDGDGLGDFSRAGSPQQVTEALLSDGIGIQHPASMFRKSAFERVGGYRAQFRFAQDTDLWLRLSEVGLIGECPEILFELIVDDHGISATRIDQQKMLWHLARECHRARANGTSEQPFLDEARRISEEVPRVLSDRQSQRQKRRAQYFIGSQLLEQRNPACRKYLLRSALEPRLTLTAGWKLLQSLMRT